MSYTVVFKHKNSKDYILKEDEVHSLLRYVRKSKLKDIINDNYQIIEKHYTQIDNIDKSDTMIVIYETILNITLKIIKKEDHKNKSFKDIVKKMINNNKQKINIIKNYDNDFLSLKIAYKNENEIEIEIIFDEELKNCEKYYEKLVKTFLRMIALEYYSFF